MEIKKTCFKCLLEKPLTEYYKHKGMSDGHLNKCKDCTKKETKDRDRFLKENDPDYLYKERKRGREKYHRLNYCALKPNKINKKYNIKSYHDKYPEKKKCQSLLGRKIKRREGHQLHHWSYNIIHATDVIELSIKDHLKAHRFIIYDQERMMYRRIDTNELLDTKEKHVEYISYCIQNKED